MYTFSCFPKNFVNMLLVMLMLVAGVSLGHTQHKRMESSRPFVPEVINKNPKTFQLFAEDDNPAGWVTVDDKNVFRQREVSFNSVFFNNRPIMKEGDKIVGRPFDDVLLEATIDSVSWDSGYKIFATLNDYNGALEISYKDGQFSFATRIYKNRDRIYKCSYNKEQDAYILVEMESRWAISERRKRAVVAAKAAGNKTVQLFAENDDPSGRMTWDKSNPRFKACERMRKASINPQLFSDRIDEILVGDRLVGQLFEDKYFEAIVVNRSEGYDRGSISLDIIENNVKLGETVLISGENSILLQLYYHYARKNYIISTTFGDGQLYVTEIDQSKIIILPDEAPSILSQLNIEGSNNSYIQTASFDKNIIETVAK